MQFEQKDPFLQLISKSRKLRSPGLDSHPTQRGQLRATTELFLHWSKGVGGDACHRSYRQIYAQQMSERGGLARQEETLPHVVRFTCKVLFFSGHLVSGFPAFQQASGWE